MLDHRKARGKRESIPECLDHIERLVAYEDDVVQRAKALQQRVLEGLLTKRAGRGPRTAAGVRARRSSYFEEVL